MISIIEIHGGDTIQDAVNDSYVRCMSATQRLCSNDNKDFYEEQFEFNGIPIHINWNSNPEYIIRDYFRYCKGYIKPDKIGPVLTELTEEQIQSDSTIEKLKQEIEKKETAERQRKQEEKEKEVNSIINGIELLLTDSDYWNNQVTINQDPYGKAVINYAARWGKLIQYYLTNELEKTFDEIASDTSYQADLEGITGFMNNCAVAILSACWIHGDKLRQWHNSFWGSPDATGVVNSCVITINDK
jgi:hypothetical protein